MAADPGALQLWESEGGGLAAPVLFTPALTDRKYPTSDTQVTIPKLRNDDGVQEIRIGMKAFTCIGVSPPHDHPHIYLNMGLETAILCPYCATAFRFDPALAPYSVMPFDCLYKLS